MNIGIDARWIFRETSGIGVYTTALIRALATYVPENEYTLFFHDPVCRDRIMNDPAIAKATGSWRAVMLPFDVFSPRGQFQLPRRLRSEGIDVFHSTNYLLPLPAFPRHRRGRIKSVVTIHDVIPLLFPNAAPKSIKRRFFFIYRTLMIDIGRRANAIISDSQASRSDVIRELKLPESRHSDVMAIHCGVDTNRFRPSKSTPPNNGMDPERERNILYVGRADPYKNIVGLLNALRIVREKCSFPVRLRIAGPPDPRYPEARQTARALKLESAVTWTGHLDDKQLVEAYRNADLLALPSYYEGFGLPVIESMACGTPVVCSNRGSLPEIAGDAAIVIDPDSRNALADAIIRVLNHATLRCQLRQAGLQRAQQFSWERTARETAKTYEYVNNLN